MPPPLPVAQHGHAPSSEAHPQATAGRGSGLAWGLAGFVIGAVFWHFIGFWGFIEKIVYNGRPSEPTTYVAQTGPDCTALELIRQTREVVAVPCPEDAELLNESAAGTRADFAGAVRTPVAKSQRNLRLSAGNE